LGRDTGFTPEDETYIPEWRAGCEHEPHTGVCYKPHDVIRDEFEKAPRFIKGPTWSYYLKFLKRLGLVEIDHVVMPMRDLAESAVSRISVGLDVLIGKNGAQGEIGFIGGDKVEQQENVLAMFTGKVLEACYIYRIPLTLMRFPRFVMDEEYCYRKVVCFDEGIDREEHRRAWFGLSDPGRIQTHTEITGERIGHPS
jgi:hypothetical protein